MAECAGLIEREVQTLESLVNEFSQFARFPSARLASADLNSICLSALDLFRGRLEGITLKTELATALPLVKADPELLRRVVANLIDNAAEAMEGSHGSPFARGDARAGRRRRGGDRNIRQRPRYFAGR